MRHAILVIGSQSHDMLPRPELALTDDEAVRMSTWYANLKQNSEARLLDDEPSVFLRILLAPILAYRFYLLVHNTRFWSGKRPLLLVRGRRLASRLAARAGTWGGGDVVKADLSDERPLGPTRFILEEGGKLRLRAEA